MWPVSWPITLASSSSDCTKSIEPLVDVDEAAHRRERVDAVVLDDLDRVRDVFARDLIPKILGDALNVGVEQRIGLDDAAGDDLLVLLLTELNFGRASNMRT